MPSVISRKIVAIDAAILFAFWLLFYIPVWIGARHVGYDMDGFNYPLDRFLLGGLRNAGQLPTWDWFSYNGVDFSGNVQAAAYYPPKLLLESFLAIARLPLSFGTYQLFALLHVLAFSFTAYFVAKSVGLERFWRITGTIFLTYTGILQAQIQHFWFIAALPWLPLIVYGAYKAGVERRTGAIYIYIIASIGLCLVGYPLQYLAIQVEVLALVLLARVFIARPLSIRSVVEPVLGFAVCQLCVMLVSAAMLLPFAALVKESIADALAGPLPLQAALTIFLPNIFGHLNGKFTLGADPTTSYFFVGFVLELAIVAAFLARGAIARSPGRFALAVVFLFANFALEFFPLYDIGFGHIPGFGYLRPQDAGMPFALAFASLVTMILVAADGVVAGRLRTALRMGAVVACVSLFTNIPGYFSTPTGPASDVEASSPGFVGGGIPDDTFSLAIDQSTIGGSADNWPRVLGIRTLGGEDPLAQRPYLDLLESKGLHNSGRRVYFSSNADFAWLGANGVGLVMTTAPDLIAFAQKEHWVLLQKPPYVSIYALPHAVPVGSSTCAKAVSVVFGVDEMNVRYDSAMPNCSLRLTTNYSPFFAATLGASIAPLPGELGMTLSGLPLGPSDIRISYSNPWAILGRWLSLLGIAVIVLAFFLSRRFAQMPVVA